MNRLLALHLVLILFFAENIYSQKKWLSNFISQTVNVSSEAGQSKVVRKKLIKAFQTSSLEAKKALRNLELPFKDIDRVTKRFSLEELSEIVELLDGLSPNATRLFLSDLARYSNKKKMQNVINVLKKDKGILVAYERVSSHMGVKFRTQVGVLLQISKKERPVKLYTTISKNYKHMYVKKIFSVNGIIYEGYFPDFKKYTMFSYTLRKQLIKSGDNEQMRSASRQLREQIKKNLKLRSKFTQEQLEAIERGDRKIPRFTWHHSESRVGGMDLVESNIHAKLSHDGGNTFWGGGNR
jgi:hypothetical protein